MRAKGKRIRRLTLLLGMLLATATLAPHTDAADDDLEGAASHAVRIELLNVPLASLGPLEVFVSVENTGDLTLKELAISVSGPETLDLSLGAPTIAQLAPGATHYVNFWVDCGRVTEGVQPVSVRVRDAKGWVASEVMLGVHALQEFGVPRLHSVRGPSRRVSLFGRPRGAARAGRPFDVDVFVGWHGWDSKKVTVNVDAPEALRLVAGTERTEVYPLQGREKEGRGSPTKTVTLTYTCDVPGRYRLRANATDYEGLYRAGALIDVEVLPADAPEPAAPPPRPLPPAADGGPQVLVRVDGEGRVVVSSAAEGGQSVTTLPGTKLLSSEGTLKFDEAFFVPMEIMRVMGEGVAAPPTLHIEADALAPWGAVAWILRLATDPEMGTRVVTFGSLGVGPQARFALRRDRIRDTLQARLPRGDETPHPRPLDVRFDRERGVVLQDSFRVKLPAPGQDWGNASVARSLAQFIERLRAEIDAGKRAQPLQDRAWIRWTDRRGLDPWNNLPYGHVLLALRVLEANGFHTLQFDRPRLPAFVSPDEDENSLDDAPFK